MDFWYIVADGASARLFQTNRRDGDLEETDRYVNEKGRLNNRDFDTDRPGRSSQSSSQRSAMEKGDGPRENEEKKFAKRIAKSLNEAFQQGKFEKLGIVAAPKALGRIREELDKQVKDAVIGTSSKNLTKQSKDEIKQHISKNIL